MARKPKRLARSQIPKKPVEMPAGIESLDVQVCYMYQLPLYSCIWHVADSRDIVETPISFLVQFGELGIDFVGLDTQSSPPETKEINVETGVGGLLPYSDLQQK